jgi:hypothetical protein
VALVTDEVLIAAPVDVARADQTPQLFGLQLFASDRNMAAFARPTARACRPRWPLLGCTKNFVVESSDFITTSGIYRMNDHPGREITLIYDDAVPTFQGQGQVSAHPCCQKS